MFGFAVLERLHDESEFLVEVGEGLEGGCGGEGRRERGWLHGEGEVVDCGDGWVGGGCGVEVESVREGDRGKGEAVGHC